MTPLSSRAIARIHDITGHPRPVEFGPLGSAVKWRKPLVGTVPIPPGVAVFKPPSAVRATGGTDARARRAGAVLTSDKALPEVFAKASGYSSSSSLTGALKRHEIVHSIQAAKRGYRTPRKIREVVKDEVGAYATMNRGVKGGSKIVRGINSAVGVPASVAIGVLNNPRLRKRAAAYGAGAAALAGGVIAAKKLRQERKDLGADTRAVVALAENIRRKFVDFVAQPRRNPQTGAFTVGGNVTAPMLRKAWRIPSRITPRAQAKTAPTR